MSAELTNLEALLGHSFQDRKLFVRALTHSSHAYENQSPGQVGLSADNEQLEFLGDAVLGFVVSDSLIRRFPSYAEGRLSNLKAHLVSAAHLYAVAQKLELGQYLFVGRSEEMSGGRGKRTLLVNGLEALIAALYLDGGMDVARRFLNCWVMGDGDGDEINEMLEEEILAPPNVNYKGELQELARLRKLPPPRYLTVEEHGPDHSKKFTIEVRLGPEWSGRGEGLSKKSAAQLAAQDVLSKLGSATPTR